MEVRRQEELMIEKEIINKKRAKAKRNITKTKSQLLWMIETNAYDQGKINKIQKELSKTVQDVKCKLCELSEPIIRIG